MDDVPAIAAAGWLRVRDEFRSLLGADLVALWAYGARVFPDPPRLLGDLDTFAVLERSPNEDKARLILDTVEVIAADVGIPLDVRFVVLADAVRSELPRDALHPEGDPDVDWAFRRAHFIAGRYVLLHGRRAEDIVSEPTWPELDAALRSELEHLERHVAAGDADESYEAAYAMLNGSRLLYALETGDVVISKRAAGDWAIRHLPHRWRGAIRAAGRTYDGRASSEDGEALRAAMAPFVAMVREEFG